MSEEAVKQPIAEQPAAKPVVKPAPKPAAPAAAAPIKEVFKRPRRLTSVFDMNLSPEWIGRENG